MLSFGSTGQRLRTQSPPAPLWQMMATPATQILDDSLPLPDGEDDADDHSGALDESLADDASEINNTELDPSEPGHDRDVIDLDSQPTEEAWTDAQPRPKDELWMSPEYEKDVEASEAEIAEMKKESMPALEVESMTGSMPALQVESAGSMPPLEVESEKAGMAPLEVRVEEGEHGTFGG